ncbi:MAG: electron transfer flavoprotein subunit alpha/FixB family protein [Dehalococcoidia bacterium]|nr:electron transfer flavoprotein subunit alpha/FixB family protein [Dehalococcoidia bacterium]
MEENSTTPSAAKKDVWVFAEHEGGELSKVSLELFSEGRTLAKRLGSDLCALLIGDRVSDLGAIPMQYGASKVYLVEDDSLRQYTGHAWIRLLADLIKERGPSIVLFGSTPKGREMAPLLAADVKGGFASECTIFDIGDQDHLLATRPINGGKLDAKCFFSSKCITQIATVRPGVIDTDEPNASLTSEIIRINVTAKEDRANSKITGFLKGDPAKIDVREAEVVIAAGRGVGGRENLRLIEELAAVLGASLGGTRCAVDMGLLSPDRLIGQTGKYISPKLYIACGISGATEHLQGIRASQHIIAINSDRNAPIFQTAKVRIVGDLREVVPAITERVRQIIGSGQVAKADAVMNSIHSN